MGQPAPGPATSTSVPSRARWFKLTTVAGGTPQSTKVGTALANPLAVTVSANNPVEPVDGGIVSFEVKPVGGASAALSANTATIKGGQASVTATANQTPGQYAVSATAAGAGYASFSLTNLGASSLSERPTPPQGTGTSESGAPDANPGDWPQRTGRHRPGRTSCGDRLRRQPSRLRHHHLRPGSLPQEAADHQTERRPAGPDQPGHHHDHRPGRQAALDPGRRQGPGLRHRGRVGVA